MTNIDMIDRNQAELPVLLTIRSEQHFEDMADRKSVV